MGWNNRQQEAIDLRGKNILVSAAAGSGKTAVLVERIRKLIMSDGVGVDELLVVTFSNAAATEMKERLVAALSEEIENDRSSDIFLRNQLNRINSANISTFHAFSMEVIRRYFYLTDVSPDFRICDEAQKSILQAEAMEELMDGFFQQRSERFIEFLNQYASGKNENDVQTMILETHRFIQSLPDPFAWLESSIDALDADCTEFMKSAAYGLISDEIEQGLRNALHCFRRAERMLEEHGIASLLPKCARDIGAVESMLDEFRRGGFDDLSRMAGMHSFEVFRAAKSESAEYDAIKEKVKIFRDKGKDIIKKRIVESYLKRPIYEWSEESRSTFGPARLLNEMVLEFDRIYKGKKREKGIIDFNDIEHYALDILRHPEVASEYRNKFSHIFIDEYQDSNAVQESLVDLIKRENNVFMVGDVKQSIYKFRLAEPELFIGKYEAFKHDTTGLNSRIDLNMNYRSKGGVIRFINEVFGRIMMPETAGIAYDDAAALHQGLPSCPDALEYPVELHVIDDKKLDDDETDDEINELKRAEVEATAVIGIIKECLGQPIFDSRADSERPIDYRDIVILFRSAKGYADVFYETLIQEGIPCYADIGEGYFDTLEVSVFLNLLRVIDNKRQDIPLISILRSPFFGFGTDELAKVRIHLRGVPFYRAFEDYPLAGGDQILAAKCRKTLEKIREWKMEAAFMPLEEFLWKLLCETGYYDYAGAIPGGTRRQANLRALMDKAAAFRNAHLKGMFGFINYIEMLQKGKVMTSQATVLSDSDNVIRIMTVHKSKGLEFPVVLACGLGKRFNRASESYKLSLHKTAGIGLRYVDAEHGCYSRTFMQAAIDIQRFKENIAEEIRILYVAMTRAMDRLILVGTIKNAETVIEKSDFKDESDIPDINNYLEWILMAAGRIPLPIRHHDRGSIGLVRKKSATERHRIGEALESGFEGEVEEMVGKAVATKLEWRYPCSDILDVQSKFSVSEISRMGGNLTAMVPAAFSEDCFKLDAEPAFRKPQHAATGAERGTVMHKIMERIEFIEDMETETVNRCIENLVLNNVISKELADMADARMITGFFRSDIGRRACQADKVFREASFNLQKTLADYMPDLPYCADEKIIIQGTIDCFFEEQGELVLLDFKTDRIRGDHESEITLMIRKYRPQIDLYRDALESSRNLKVREAWLYLFDIGQSVRVFP